MPIPEIPINYETNNLINEFNTPITEDVAQRQYDEPTHFIGYNDHPLIHQAFVEAWKNSGQPTGVKPPTMIGLYGDPQTSYNIKGFFCPENKRLAYSRNSLMQALEHQDPIAYGSLVHEMTHYIQTAANIPESSYELPIGQNSLYSLGDKLETANNISKIAAPANANENGREYHASRSGRVATLEQQQAIKKIQDGIANNPVLPAQLESTKFNGAA